MKTARFLFVLGVLASGPLTLHAGIRPSFSEEYCVWHASHVVLATEGDRIDGRFTVLESWSGDLKEGETVTIPGLATFRDQNQRKIFRFSKEPGAPDYVMAERMVLFLKRNQSTQRDSSKVRKSEWLPASRFGGMKVSVVWIERDKAYSFEQIQNPGPSLLVSMGCDTKGFKDRVLQILNTKRELEESKRIADSATRAKALQRFTSSKHYYAREDAFVALGKCGENALPLLRQMLKDQSTIRRHADVVEALSKAGGDQVVPDLIALVEQELVFWRQRAPTLKVGWWNGTGVDPEEVESLQSRYGKVLNTFYAFQRLQHLDCQDVVTRFRNFWRSLPQLEDKSGLDQMSEACDHVLIKLRDKRATTGN